MEGKIILGRIVQRFIDQTYAQVEGYNRFSLKAVSDSSIEVWRENSNTAHIPFSKILIGIEAYRSTPDLYHSGPAALRTFGITHVTSPIFALLHLLAVDVYK